MIFNILALCFGASLGAMARWGLGIWLNGKALSIATLPLGTLLVNWLGAWIIGIFIVLFDSFPQIDPIWRIAVITGFLGALTTFSTFSSEVVAMLIEGRYTWAIFSACLHLFGSLLWVVFGMKCANWLIILIK